MVQRMEVRHKGHRYWATGPFWFEGSRFWWRFWSDHKWPFYHGSITLPVNDSQLAYKHFLVWLPFSHEQTPDGGS